MTVTPKNGKIEKFEQTATVSAESIANFGVRGLDASQSAQYVGSYDVSVECEGGDALTGSFEVVAAGADDPGAGGGGDLPRTGSEALPLVASPSPTPAHPPPLGPRGPGPALPFSVAAPAAPLPWPCPLTPRFPLRAPPPPPRWRLRFSRQD